MLDILTSIMVKLDIDKGENINNMLKMPKIWRVKGEEQEQRDKKTEIIVQD